ncbi:MAG: hypothetical protein R3A78_00550 [Polyangiales bacterium]
MNANVWKAAGALFAVFFLGVITGGGMMYVRAERNLANLVSPDAGPRGEWRMHALNRALGLDDAQREKVRAIFRAHATERRARLDDAMDKCGDPLREMKAKMDAEIRAVLRPDQQRTFDRIAARQDARMFRGRAGRHGGGKRPSN